MRSIELEEGNNFEKLISSPSQASKKNEGADTRKLANLTPINTALSQTMSPMNLNETSKKTIGIVSSSLDDITQVMARTFVSSSANTSKEVLIAR